MIDGREYHLCESLGSECGRGCQKHRSGRRLSKKEIEVDDYIF